MKTKYEMLSKNAYQNALNELVDINYNGEDAQDIMEQARDKLQELITPPTEEEVKKALSEWLNRKGTITEYEVYGNKNGFSYETLRYGSQDICFKDGDIIDFSVALPPYLITLIGRFYEGLIDNE